MSELRQDLTSGEWILLSPGRAARPNFLNQKKASRKPTPKSQCPFEDLSRSGNNPIVIAYPNEKQWKVAVIPNKYPALQAADKRSHLFTNGIYRGRTAVGTHRLLVTRDHNKAFVDLPKREAARVFDVLQKLYVQYEEDPSVAHITAFYNYGLSAGASLWHPHYQILTLPIIPFHTQQSLDGAKRYYKKHHRCARCAIIAFERKAKVRVIAETEHAIAFAPYAAAHAFEVSVMPKRHWSSFRQTPPAAVREVAVLLQFVLGRMRKYMNDPDLNFFLHETPLDGRDHAYHHWHLEVIPRVTIDAGFEFSTGIAINVADPDKAAATLRGKHPWYAKS